MSELFDRGALRIGTLFDWRRTGNHGEMVADPAEGMMPITGNVITYDWRFIHKVLVEGTVDVVDSGPNKSRHFTNSLLHCDDVYTFSATSTYSEDDHKTWFNVEGYDACYRIVQPEPFFQAISYAMNACTFATYGNIHYYDPALSNQTFGDPFHPALLKHKAFGSQNEVRAIWHPSTLPIDPMIVSSSGIGLFCTKHRTF